MTSPAPVAPPGPGLEPILALSLGLSASPGAYAVLLGSGVSRAAKIPTGWEVVLDLIRRVAAMSGEEAVAAPDPEAWWAERGHGEPRYDTLLEMLAPSVAARRDLLHNYFEPTTDEEREQGVKQPTAAHRAIAALVAMGAIRLVLTTNFDRLMERALDDAGVSPQVVSRPDDIIGMAPLQHARATVIKLHGDYLDVEAIRNTPTELASYDPATKALLNRILDEYGLVALGWSGEWDMALVHAIQSAPARRYPMYWTAHRGVIADPARRLLAIRAGHLIPIDGADQFGLELCDKVGALKRMADPPPTRAVAVSTLKRNLQRDRRIELFDQFTAQTNRTLDRLTADRYQGHLPGLPTSLELGAELQRQVEQYDQDTDVLAALVAVAAFHGTAATDVGVVRTVRRLAERPRPADGPRTPPLDQAYLYPALRLATVAGTAYVAAHREGLLIRLLVKTTIPSADQSSADQGEDTPLVDVLRPELVLDPEVANYMPRNAGARLFWPWSRCLKDACRSPLAEVTDDREFSAAFNRYEFLRSMIEGERGSSPALGDFAGRLVHQDETAPAHLILAEIDETWPLLVAGGFGSDAEKARRAYAILVAHARSFRQHTYRQYT